MNKLLIILLLTIPVTLIIWSKYVHAEDDNELHQVIKHFGKVDVNLYRGGQPDEHDLKLLKEFGIKKVINLRYEKDLIEAERKQVEALGMEYVNIPWTILSPYDQNIFDNFFEAIEDKESKPVFFHCKRGSERTGVLASVYKIKVKGLGLDEALEDTKKYNVKFIWRPFVNSKIRTFYKKLHTK